MKKIITLSIIVWLFNITQTFAWINISSSTPIVWTIYQSDYENNYTSNWNLSFEKIIFPKVNWVKVDASWLTNDSNANLIVTWNFWIKWIYNSSDPQSWWATFDIDWQSTLLENNWDETFNLIWNAWLKDIWWIIFGDSWVLWGNVIYNRVTWKIEWAWWSDQLWWIPMDWLTLITTAPEIWKALNNNIYSTWTHILWSVYESDYETDYTSNWNLSFEKSVFPNQNWINLDASILKNNINSDLSITWNFWIKWIYDSSDPSSWWATFNTPWNTSILRNNYDNTFNLIWNAWLKDIWWISFWKSWVSGWEVIYYKNTWKFSWAWWSNEIWWIPMDDLKLNLYSTPIIGNKIFAANNDILIWINSLDESIITNIENHDSVAQTTYLWKYLHHNFEKVKPWNYNYTTTDSFWNSNSWEFQIVAWVPGYNTSIININDWVLADWDEKANIILQLIDIYNNPVVNIPWIKEVLLNIEFNNNVDKDQIVNNDSWDAINFISNDFPNLTYQNLSDTSSNTIWDYFISITSLAPTKEAYTYTNNNNDINIKSLSYNINSLWWDYWIWETDDYINLVTESNKLIFTPVVKVEDININPEILFRDFDAQFTSNINIDNPINKIVKNIETGHLLDIWWNDVMSFRNITSSWNIVCTWYNMLDWYIITDSKCNKINQNKSSNILFKNSWIVSNNYNDIFKATPKVVLIPIENFDSNYLSEITYDIWWEIVKYPSFIKSLNELVKNTFIKVAWLSNEWIELFEDNKLNILNTNLNRPSFRKQIAKNVILVTKNWTNTNIDYKTNNYTIYGWPDWKDTIIVEWWDLIIKWNLLKNNSEKLNSIIVLKDSDWNWWNIRVQNNVTFISSVIFADKHLISWDWNTYYTDSEWNANNQIFFKWSISTSNTIWSSSITEIECPYPIQKKDCTEKIANRYDLNHFRHFISWVTWKWTPLNTWTYWEDYVNMSKWDYIEASMIIEYDPLLQINPPYVFKLNK